MGMLKMESEVKLCVIVTNQLIPPFRKAKLARTICCPFPYLSVTQESTHGLVQ